MAVAAVARVVGPMALVRTSLSLAYRSVLGCFDTLIQTAPGRLLAHYVGNVSSFMAKCVVVWLICTILLISSAVLYFTFHYSMMPTMLVTVPVHFQFSSACSRSPECAFPRAQVYLLDGSAAPLLHPHVHYTIALEMDMPESDANKQAGMFMVQLNLTSFDGSLVGTSSRANVLRYRSRLLGTVRTLLLCPLLIAGYEHEQQRITTELFSAYLVLEERPVTSAWLEVRSEAVQLYGARLRVHARLSGLRRLMYQHPLLTGLVGTAATFCSLSLLFLMLWLRSSHLPPTIAAQLRMASQLVMGAQQRQLPSDISADTVEAEESASPKEKAIAELDEGADEPVEELGSGRPSAVGGAFHMPPKTVARLRPVTNTKETQ